MPEDKCSGLANIALLARMMSGDVTTGLVVHRNEWRELCLKARQGEAVPPNPYETRIPTSYMGLPVTVTDLPWMEGLFVELKNGETWEEWQRKRVEAHQHSQEVGLEPGDV